MGQTVNLLAYAFGGSNPSLPTHFLRDCAARINDTVSFFSLSQKEHTAVTPPNAFRQHSSVVMTFGPTKHSPQTEILTPITPITHEDIAIISPAAAHHSLTGARPAKG